MKRRQQITGNTLVQAPKGLALAALDRGKWLLSLACIFLCQPSGGAPFGPAVARFDAYGTVQVDIQLEIPSTAPTEFSAGGTLIPVCPPPGCAAIPMSVTVISAMGTPQSLRLRAAATSGALDVVDLQAWVSWKANGTPQGHMQDFKVVAVRSTEDLEPVRSHIQQAPAPLKQEQATIDFHEPVQNFVDRWLKAWASADFDGYIGFYSPEFKPADGVPRAQWLATRRLRVAERRGPVVISCSRLRSQPVAGAPHVKVECLQTYTSQAFVERGIKTLVISKHGNDWRILAESFVKAH